MATEREGALQQPCLSWAKTSPDTPPYGGSEGTRGWCFCSVYSHFGLGDDEMAWSPRCPCCLAWPCSPAVQRWEAAHASQAEPQGQGPKDGSTRLNFFLQNS